MNPFSVLTSKIFAGTTVAFVALALFFYIGNVSRDAKIARMETAAVAMKAAVDRQNEAVTRLQSASARLIAKAQEARQNADEANAPLRDDVAKIRAAKPAVGCATPVAIMRSGI